MKRYINLQKGNPIRTRIIGTFLLLFSSFFTFAQIQISHTDVTCTGSSDGTATVTGVNNGTPPFHYVWSNGDTTAGITHLPEGVYTVSVTDNNGCTGTESAEIVLSMTTLHVSVAQVSETCDNTHDGMAWVTSVMGGAPPYTYLWSNGETSSQNVGLTAGTYVVTVTDTNDCHGTDSVFLKVDDNAYPVSIIATTPPSCFGASDGTATASASGGQAPYTYAWSNVSSGATASGLAAGTYKVLATDSVGCHGNTSATITDPSKLLLSISGGNTIVQYCNNSTPTAITLSASASGGAPPYNYSWPGGSLTVSGSGFYCCSVTDSNGCNASKCVYVLYIPVQCSSDPNIIAGPAGFAEKQWVSVNDHLSYTVYFENDPFFATAPAQEVRVTVPLNDKINLYSLRVGNFGFGDFNFSIPPNTSYYTKRLDVVDSLGVYVDIITGVDVVTEQAFWIFQSIDPATGLPPVDPQVGFLPVNDTNTHSGEGFVTFTLQPKFDDISGDSILAQSEIVFDINEPLKTNQWFNIVDAVHPTSSVDTLVLTSPSSLDITFTGQDDTEGCGLQKFLLYYSKDYGPYILFGEYNAGKVAHLSGIENSEYRFFSIAKDYVGNTEPMKNMPEETIVLGYPSLISGTVTYQNNANTPVSNALVYLRQNDGTKIDSVSADQNGAYDFGYKPQKNYLIDAFSDFPWGGVNSTDALLVRRATIGLSYLNRLQDSAADVNHSNSISSTDALLIRRRVVGQIDNFQINDLVFLKDTVVVSDSNITHDIKTLCAGDVNGSFTPVILKSSGITLDKKGEISAGRNQHIDLPIMCENMIRPAAVTLLLDYPETIIEVEKITTSLPGLLYTAKKGKIIIAWDSLSPATFNNNDVLLVLHLKVNEGASENDIISLNLDPGSEFADKTADLINSVSLSYPNVVVSTEPDFELSQNYPNPFSKKTEIGYVLPEEGSVLLEAYNVLGQKVKTIVSSRQKAGKYNVRFDGSKLGSGTYYYKITVEGVTRNFTATHSMVILPNN